MCGVSMWFAFFFVVVLLIDQLEIVGEERVFFL
jgi:hypothetical protein